MIYIGLPQWSHPKWARLGITSLEEYARHFNCDAGILKIIKERPGACAFFSRINSLLI